MQIEKYELEADESLTRFDFISVGRKGVIRKQIQFQPTKVVNLYNLAFGDIDTKGNIDDMAVSDNGGTQKILFTVVSALYAFFFQYPNALVYAAGSTKARTRLYPMGIPQNLEEIQKNFNLLGQIGERFTIFEKGVEYDGFLIQQKFY